MDRQTDSLTDRQIFKIDRLEREREKLKELDKSKEREKCPIKYVFCQFLYFKALKLRK